MQQGPRSRAAGPSAFDHSSKNQFSNAVSQPISGGGYEQIVIEREGLSAVSVPISGG